MLKKYFIRNTEFGLRFDRGQFAKLLAPGEHRIVDPLGRVCVQTVNAEDPQLAHPQLREVVRSGALDDVAIVADLGQHERAIVRVDGRLHSVLQPGLFAFFTTHRTVEIETIDARPVRIDRDDIPALVNATGGAYAIEQSVVQTDHAGVLTLDGKFVEVLQPGRYAFWKNERDVRVLVEDLREQVIDVGGQEILTADNVSLRVNALAAFRVVDVRKAVETTSDLHGLLYREVQLALRAAVGTRDLQSLLAAKEAVAEELVAAVRGRAGEVGVEIVTVGIKDLILPGEMKALLGRVTEAKTAAEADLIRRKEETAAIRSQANTAKILENNPTLMRLRELEVLETVAKSTKLEVLLSNGGLREQVMKLV